MKRISAVGRARIGLIEFPGSNCDWDCKDVLERHFGIATHEIWHTATELPPIDALILPGGFSYGDYLRGGSLASHSRVMPSIRAFARSGGTILGICNGFQVLTEAGLLPGALLPNISRRFVCKFVHLSVPEGESTYHRTLSGQTLRIPIAHGEGRYYIENEDLRRIEDSGQVVFKYVDGSGEAGSTANPNGSTVNIAGVSSENHRVVGLMPHPERACDRLLGGSEDGRKIWEAFLASFM